MGDQVCINGWLHISLLVFLYLQRYSFVVSCKHDCYSVLCDARGLVSIKGIWLNTEHMSIVGTLNCVHHIYHIDLSSQLCSTGCFHFQVYNIRSSKVLFSAYIKLYFKMKQD